MDNNKAKKMSELHRKIADMANDFVKDKGLSLEEVQIVFANLWKEADEQTKEKPDTNYIG